MEDSQVVEAFLDGAPEATGQTLHIEENALVLAGWWHAVVRLGNDAFIVRTEPAPDDSPVVSLVGEALSRRGLVDLGEHPLILPITYTEVSTAGGVWRLWAGDAASGELALTARAGAESAPREWAAEDSAPVEGMATQLEGARRIAGLPPSVIVSVGLARDKLLALEAAVPECRFEARALGEITPEACGDLGPALILVDAAGREGREFIMELRAAACGRFLPVAAVSGESAPPLGADVALDPAVPARAWRDELLRLLPDSGQPLA